MARRSAFLAGGLLIAATLIVIGLVAFRAALAELVIVRALEARGLSPVALSVTDISPNELNAENLVIGPTLEVRRLKVHYQLSELLRGQVRGLTIEAPRLALDLTGKGSPLGPLAPLLDGGGTGETGRMAMPMISVTGGRIEAQSDLGPLVLTLDAFASPDLKAIMMLTVKFGLEGPNGSLEGTLSAEGDPAGELLGTAVIDRGRALLASHGIAAESLSGALAFTLNDGRPSELTLSLSLDDLTVDRFDARGGQLALDVTPQAITFDAGLTTADGSLELEGDLGRSGNGSTLRVHGRLEAQSLAQLAPFLPPAAAWKGTLASSLSIRGKIPALDPFESDPEILRTRLLAGTWAGNLDLDVAGLDIEDAIENGHARLGAGLALADSRLAITFDHPSEVGADRLGEDWLAASGVPRTLAQLLRDGGRMDLSGGRQSADLSVFGLIDELEVTATAAPSLSLAEGAGLEAGGSLQVMLAPDRRLHGLAIKDMSLAGKGLLIGDLETETLNMTGQLELSDTTLALTELSAAVTGAKVDGTAFPPAVVTGDLTGSGDQLDGRLRLTSAADRAAIDDVVLRGFTMASSVDLTVAEGVLAARLTEPGILEATQIRIRDRVLLEGGGGFTIARAGLRVPLAGPPLTFDVALRPLAKPRAWQGGLLRGDRPPIGLQVRPQTIDLSGTLEPEGRLWTTQDIRLRAIALPDLELTISDVRLSSRMDHGDGTAKAEVGVRSLGLEDRLALTAPAGLAGRLTRTGDRFAFDGHLTGPAPLDRARLRLEHRADQERGTAEIDFGELTLAPGTLQPSDLSAHLAPLAQVEGRVRASADLAWDRDGLASSARLGLSDLSLTAADLRFAGLDLDLQLNDLLSPRSPAGQPVRLKRLTGPVEVESLAGSFRVEPGAPAKVLVEQLSFESIGGRFSASDVLLDPASDAHTASVRVDALDLARLTRALEIDDVSGSGTLEGRIPLQFAEGRLLITDAELRSTGPGVLRYRSAEAAERPADVDLDSLDLVDDPFALTLLALENFHYESLGIGMGHEADGRASLKLALKGKNPDLLDGYPFELNVNLDTNLSPLLQAIEDGLLVTKDLLPGRWSFGP